MSFAKPVIESEFEAAALSTWESEGGSVLADQGRLTQIGEKLMTDRNSDGLHADQESILEHLRTGPQSWSAIRRRLDVLESDTRASETRRQLVVLLAQGLIEEYEDSHFRLTTVQQTFSVGGEETHAA